MSTPLFANNWYGQQLPVDEVRKEVQAIYGLIDANEAGVPSLDGYYTSAEVDALLGLKSDVGHPHLAADITNLSSYTGLDGRYYTESEVDGLLGGKANTAHTHSVGDLTDFPPAYQSFNESWTGTTRTIAMSYTAGTAYLVTILLTTGGDSRSITGILTIGGSTAGQRTATTFANNGFGTNRFSSLGVDGTGLVINTTTSLTYRARVGVLAIPRPA